MRSDTSPEAQAFQPWHLFTIVTMLAATGAVLVARETSFENLILISLTVMAAGLAALAVHRTLWPLASADEPQRSHAIAGRSRLALEREKALVLRSIKELEFDRAMGKIADADFHEMVGRLRARAIGLMKQLDEEPREWREAIERELARRRGRAASPAAAHEAPRASGVACACGTANDADARFCKNCGAQIEGTPASDVQG